MKNLFCSVLLALGLAPSGNAAAPARPNVLFIAIDDLRDWVGYLGRNPQTLTPNIDRLAARGVRFTRSYCAAPVCNPSRAALMSGLRPFTTGIYDNQNDWRTAIAEDLPLTTTFRKAGYFVCGAGKIYHEAYRRRSEWDDYLQNAGRDPQPTGDTGVGGIKFAPLDCKDEDLREWKIVGYANQPGFASSKAELSKYLPNENHPDIGGRRGQDAEDSGPAQTKPSNGK